MPKLSRPIQILLPPWLDDWMTMLSTRYGVSKAMVMRNHLASGILMWSRCVQREEGCPVINKLVDNSAELKRQIFTGATSQEDIILLSDDLAFEARIAIQERKEKIK